MKKEVEKEISIQERVEQLKRFEGYLLNALDVLEASGCFSNTNELRKHLGIESSEDAKYLELENDVEIN